MAEAVKTAVAEKPKTFKSFFLSNKLNRFPLDDNYYIEHKLMDEGTYELFQDLTSTIKLDREGETTELDMALGKTRKFLLETLVTGWNLVEENGDAVAYTVKKLRDLPPHLVADLVKDIYDKNPILSGESEEGKDT